MIVNIQKNINVPEGKYCNNPVFCEQISTSYTNIDWSDGLGSPSTMVSYHCNTFNMPLYSDYNKIKKCEKCLQYNKK